ncbi:uncharacterized protein LOC100372411 [Saccoglossus kowalevskii]|uniref:Serine/arginine repetitive matrix protein 1-like n=1 Tax=Saccoglossus kowalevskii TaxID=10224 RepID=A0ABM0LYD7_SACKO|nr:PREDICTED: serine/arginine repetitive matrix protein 1-like [Saccoglossus kowalevskii]
MLDPSLPWLAVGYRNLNKEKFTRRRYEKEDYSSTLEDRNTDEDVRMRSAVSNQRQRVKSATTYRHYYTARNTSRPRSASSVLNKVNRPLSAQSGRYAADGRYTPSDQMSLCRLSSRRRVKSATTRRHVVPLQKSHTLIERFYHNEKITHINEHEHSSEDRCVYCPVECRPPSSSTNRPTSSTGLVAARLPSHFDRFIHWTRPSTAPATRKEFLQLPRHNGVRRGNVPHYTNFVRRIDLGIRDRTPSPPPRTRRAFEEDQPRSVSSLSAVHSASSHRYENGVDVGMHSEGDSDWQDIEIREELAPDQYDEEAYDDAIHIPTPTPEPKDEELFNVVPPDEVSQAWLEHVPHAPTPTPATSDGIPTPRREPSPPLSSVKMSSQRVSKPTTIDIPERVPSPPPTKTPTPPSSPKPKKEVRIQETVQTIPSKPRIPKEKKEKKGGQVRRVSNARKESLRPEILASLEPAPVEEEKQEVKEEKVEEVVEKPEVIIPALPAFQEKQRDPVPEPTVSVEKQSMSVVADVVIKEPEPEPEVEELKEEKRKKLNDPPSRNKVQDLFALDPNELLDMEMKMRRRGPGSQSDADSAYMDLQAPAVDTMDRKSKIQPWLQGRLAFSKQTARFEIPMDVRVLKNMTPVEYLTQYCIVSKRRQAFYRRHFNKVDRDNDLKINRKELEQALKNVHVDAITSEEIDKIVELVDLDDENYKFMFKLFSAMCALSERILYPNFVTEDTAHLPEHQKEKVEDADFSALDWKLDGYPVNPPVKKILYML